MNKLISILSFIRLMGGRGTIVLHLLMFLSELYSSYAHLSYYTGIRTVFCVRMKWYSCRYSVEKRLRFCMSALVTVVSAHCVWYRPVLF